MSMAPAGVPYADPAATEQRYRSICTLLNCPAPPVVLPLTNGSTTGRTAILLVENGRSRPSAAGAPTRDVTVTAATPRIANFARMAPPDAPGRGALLTQRTGADDMAGPRLSEVNSQAGDPPPVSSCRTATSRRRWLRFLGRRLFVAG